MSRLSTAAVRRMKLLRDRVGQDVVFSGETFRVLYRESIAGKTGTVALPQGEYGPMIAAFEPVEFNFSPQDFAPYTDRTIPVEGDYIERMSLWHRITRIDFDNVDDDTISIKAFGYKDINYLGPGLTDLSSFTTTTGDNDMAGATHAYKLTFTADGVTKTTPTDTLTGDGTINKNVTVPNGTTKAAIAATFTVASIKSVYLLATKAMTLYTNIATNPGNTIVLPANKAVFYNANSPASQSNPFTSDVTGLFISNASGEEGEFFMSVLQDSSALEP